MLGFLIIAALVATHAPADLVAAAAASGKPRRCIVTSGDRSIERHNLWAAARRPQLKRYCQLMGQAHSRLEGAPFRARKAARAADRTLPGQASPILVLAELAMHRERTSQALLLFRKALARDPKCMRQVQVMHGFALAQATEGQLTASLSTYRELVVRLSLLPEQDRRARVLLEAAHVAMAVAASVGSPTARRKMLAEATAYLREALRTPHHALRLDVALSLALVLDRAGHRARADALLREQAATASWAHKTRLGYWTSKSDLPALRAIAVERTDPAAASTHYAQYLATNPTPTFRLAAEARLRRLAERRPSKRRRTRRRPLRQPLRQPLRRRPR